MAACALVAGKTAAAEASALCLFRLRPLHRLTHRREAAELVFDVVLVPNAVLPHVRVEPERMPAHGDHPYPDSERVHCIFGVNAVVHLRARDPCG